MPSWTNDSERWNEGELWLWQPSLFTPFRAVRRLNTTKSDSQSDKSLLCFAKGVWCTQFQSSFLNVYLRLSGFQSSPLPICYRDGPNGCLHCTKVHHESYPTSFSLISLMLSSQNMHMELWHVAILSPIHKHTHTHTRTYIHTHTHKHLTVDDHDWSKIPISYHDYNFTSYFYSAVHLGLVK